MTHLDGCLMSSKDLAWFAWVIGVPDAYQVVVASTGQFGAVGRPLESTHLQPMMPGLCDYVLRLTHVVVVNDTILTPTIGAWCKQKKVSKVDFIAQKYRY